MTLLHSVQPPSSPAEIYEIVNGRLMEKREMAQKLCQTYPLEEEERILRIVSGIPEKILDVLQNIIKPNNSPQRGNGTPIRGKYEAETKTIMLYENTFDANILFHELGHCIYHEFAEVTEITNRVYKDDPLYEIETTGEGLSERDGASEFCATAYELYKSGDVIDQKYGSLIKILKEMQF